KILDPVVQTQNGLVQGVVNEDETVVVFKGIPYAAPPVGNLRWREPQPPASWEGVRDASDFCESCMQGNNSRLPWTPEFMNQTEVSEDCLYLNIWTSAKTASDNLGVFVYFHGGGFGEGSGSIAAYNGEGLAKKGGIIVINVNYRLGALGFLAHPELTAKSPNHASGNYGLLDMIAALKWVKANIEAFGGDPNKVCISGQSAGAMAVAGLIASPLAKGLFQRAMTQSGSSFRGMGSGNMTTLAEAEARGVEFAKRKGASTLAELRTISAEEIIKQDETAPPAMGMGFGMINDGYFLTDSPANILDTGEQNDTPFITGGNSGEMGYRGEKSDAFFELYPLGPDNDTANALKIAGVESGRLGAYLYLDQRAKTSKTNGYVYFFDQAIPWPEHPEFGAFHTSEAPYVFNSFDMLDRPWTAGDSLVADRMASYWANFVTNGDPNGPGLPEWRAFDPNDKSVMRLSEDMGMIPVASSEERYDFLLEQLMKPVSISFP
ncbi:MAG: carboxylesterase family protein, partial [Bacteroidales bacterium]|nr:carboxylesterase family protein [Bacteroidales bacterium]